MRTINNDYVLSFITYLYEMIDHKTDSLDFLPNKESKLIDFDLDTIILKFYIKNQIFDFELNSNDEFISRVFGLDMKYLSDYISIGREFFNIISKFSSDKIIYIVE